MSTQAERYWLGMVASLPCCLCGAHGVEVHHIRTGQGMGQRAHHHLVIPLCADCHRGPMGIHGDRTMLNIQKVTELDLLDKTIAKVVSRIV